MAKKVISLVCAAVLVLSFGAVSLAENSAAVDTIMSVGTTQAFTEEPVSTDDLKTILQAGLAAASAINQQPWYFVAVTNRELMQEIAGSGMAAAQPAAASLGYGVKIVSSPTMTLNGANHDVLCEKMGVDTSMQAVAVLLIGRADVDAVSSATTREPLETKTSIIE